MHTIDSVLDHKRMQLLSEVLSSRCEFSTMAMRGVLLLLLVTQSLCVSGPLELNFKETAWRIQTGHHKKVLSNLLPNKKVSSVCLCCFSFHF